MVYFANLRIVMIEAVLNSDLEVILVIIYCM